MMNKDIRLSIGFLDHPKTIKLKRKLGPDGMESLIRLWFFCAQYKPSGELNGLEAEDVEIAAKWNGEPGLFLETILALRFLDECDGYYSLHDWREHNGFAAYANERSEQARNAASAKWKRSETDPKQTRSRRLSEAKKRGNHTEAEWVEMREFFGTCVKCRGESGLTQCDRDHIIPMYQGGSHGIDNIQPLCAKCNASKGPDCTDYRIAFCRDAGIEMPAKWLQGERLRDACGTPAAMPAEMHPPSPIPSPYPFPSPSPNPAPKDKSISSEPCRAPEPAPPEHHCAGRHESAVEESNSARAPQCEMVMDRFPAEHGAKDEGQHPFICIPTNQSGLEVAITDAMIREYQALYPAVDVKQALREIRAWNLSNPRKRKTKTGVLRHVNRWLSEIQNRGGMEQRPRARSPDCDRPQLFGKAGMAAINAIKAAKEML